MSAKTLKIEKQRVDALKAHLLGRKAANPSTLARSYGLPEPQVGRIMRELGVSAS